MSVIDWNAKREPWRTMGIEFCRYLGTFPKKPETPIVVGPYRSSGETVLDLRRKCGMTQEDLAKRCGFDVCAVHRIETGKTRNPRLVTMQSIAQVLGVPITDIWPTR
jgi:DNA-binding XRE family transcriptional regulator